MSKEKRRHKKKHHKDSTNENEDERSGSQLFTETDAKSVEITGYTVGRGAPQTDPLMQGRGVPTGVVGVDESVILPTAPTKSHHQHRDSKPYIIRPSKNYRKEHDYLPPIFHHDNQYYPYGYFYPPLDYDHSGQLSHPYPVYQQHHSPPHHHHHHHHHHHRHKQEVETYDPRWWYMPDKSVHKPKLWQTPEYRYSPPKWYELSSSHSRIEMTSQESKSSSQKYSNCRCEVCRPSKQRPRGTKWIVNE